MLEKIKRLIQKLTCKHDEKYEGYDLTNPYKVKKLDAIGNKNS